MTIRRRHQWTRQRSGRCGTSGERYISPAASRRRWLELHRAGGLHAACRTAATKSAVHFQEPMHILNVLLTSLEYDVHFTQVAAGGAAGHRRGDARQGALRHRPVSSGRRLRPVCQRVRPPAAAAALRDASVPFLAAGHLAAAAASRWICELHGILLRR